MRDVLTGCWPGQLHFFRGTKDGGFAASTPLAFADGKPIELGSASTVFAHDWEGDGDLDLLVGDIDGQVHLVPNASGGKALAFEAAQQVRAGGKDLVVNGDSGPVVADWDVDGRQDLIVGAGDGAVTWYRNLAREGAPMLAAGVTLVPSARTPGRLQPITPSEPVCGMRTKVAVADWNEDGRLDLLVGDFGSSSSEAPTLTPEQSKQRDDLQAEQQKLANDFSSRYQTALREAAKAEGLTVGEGEDFEPTQDKALMSKISERAIASLEGDGGFMPTYQKRMGELWQELQPLMPKHEMHGHVWFFARTSGGDLASAPATAPAPVVLPALPLIPAQRTVGPVPDAAPAPAAPELDLTPPSAPPAPKRPPNPPPRCR
jgi:hypothetical protein